MDLRPAHLVHTEWDDLIESTGCRVETGSTEPGMRSSAAEHHVHTVGVTGSIPVASTTPGWVYFIRAETLGLIKIGMAVDVPKRLKALRVGSPDHLEVIGVIRTRNPAQLELNLHQQFRSAVHHGEWFNPTPALLAHIEREAIDHDTAYALWKSSIWHRMSSPGCDIEPIYERLRQEWLSGGSRADLAADLGPDWPRAYEKRKPARTSGKAALREYKAKRGIT